METRSPSLLRQRDGYACVGNEYVEPAQLRNNFLDDTLGRDRVLDVDCKGDHPRVWCLDQNGSLRGLQGLRAARDERDRCTSSRVLLRYDRTNAARCTGYQHGFASKGLFCEVRRRRDGRVFTTQKVISSRDTVFSQGAILVMQCDVERLVVAFEV